MPEGGTVTVRAENAVLRNGQVSDLPAGFYVFLSIADTGMGIPPEFLVKIFDPYFTTKPHGSGLGLATVYSIIRKHGGSIDAGSKPGAGTWFNVWLPAAPDAKEEAGGTTTEFESGLHGKVLLMDDERPICEIAGRLFAKNWLGFRHSQRRSRGRAALPRCNDSGAHVRFDNHGPNGAGVDGRKRSDAADPGLSPGGASHRLQWLFTRSSDGQLPSLWFLRSTAETLQPRADTPDHAGCLGKVSALTALST